MMKLLRNHFSIIYFLFKSRRVPLWSKLLLVGLPLLYFVIPVSPAGIPDDLLPVIGFLDDILLIAIGSVIFRAAAPREALQEYQQSNSLPGGIPFPLELDRVRMEGEARDLAQGFAWMVLFIILGGYFAGLLITFIFLISYAVTRSRSGQLLANALRVSEFQLAEVNRAFEQAQVNLPKVDVNLFVQQDPRMNAYTFGVRAPFCIVLTSALVEKMSRDELCAVIGHEMGHILFGNTQLMTLMGAQFGLSRYFLNKWMRSIEYSADGAALVACGGKAETVISALVKVHVGLNHAVNVQQFLDQLHGEDEQWSRQAELFSTHPFLNNRVKRLLELQQKINIEEGARYTER